MSGKQPVIVSTMVPAKTLTGKVYTGSERIHETQHVAFAHKALIGEGIVLGNSSCAKPTGFALTPGLNEPFSAGKTLTPDSFKCLVMCKIAPAPGHEEPGFFSDKLEAISEACPQFSDVPISSKTRTSRNTDAGYWGHELGENGYVGILKDAPVPGAHPMLSDPEHYLVVSVGAPVLGAELIKDFEAEGLKWGQVITDKRLLYWKTAAERNAKRNAYAAAEAMGIKIQTDAENSSVVFRADPDNEAVRRTAAPEVVQFVSSVVGDTQYNHCAPISAISSQTGSLFQVNSGVAGRKEKIALVAASPFSHHLVTLPSATVNSSIIPTVTGRSGNVYSDASFVSKAPKLAAHISTNFTWEGQTASMSQSATGDQTASIAQSATSSQSQVNDRFNPSAYRQFDNSFFAQHFAPVGTDIQNKVPIVKTYATAAMKVASRNLQRPQ